MGATSSLQATASRWLGALALLAAAVLSGCAALPANVQRTPSEAMADVAATPLARLAASSTPDDKRHLSGLRLLPHGPEALATRLAMLRRAQKSIDVQYYVVAPDDSGRQFLRGLRDAATRGVRVRLLIDDLHAGAQDELLLGLAAHDNVQVRLFNPLPVRGAGFQTRLLLSLHQFERVNRRMHNKLLVADNSIAVTGGRNIANEYFMRSETANFIDMDVLSVGPVVRSLSDVFDRYWNSELAFPVEALLSRYGTREQARARFDDWAGSEPANWDADGLPAQLSSHEAIELNFAPVSVFADEPSKASGGASPATAMDSAISTLRSAQSEVLIVSPYFVPGENGLRLMQAAIDKGIHVSVMTNSLAATDEPLAHGGYARYRAPMLKLGVSLSELSPVPSRKFDMIGDLRSSLGRLHAKVAVVDRRWLMVGSMNMDARSSRSNTEISLVIDDRALATAALVLMQQRWSDSHYRLRMGQHDNRVEWIEPDEVAPVVHRAEPHVSWLSRLRLSVLSMFVAEDLL
ncbi:MAG TPA: phospholipase D family protein [Burkholderiaceae bacterium]|nr:phospholipase D family protein [Burkholderiaceae bacterium]